MNLHFLQRKTKKSKKFKNFVIFFAKTFDNVLLVCYYSNAFELIKAFFKSILKVLNNFQKKFKNFVKSFKKTVDKRF